MRFDIDQPVRFEIDHQPVRIWLYKDEESRNVYVLACKNGYTVTLGWFDPENGSFQRACGVPASFGFTVNTDGQILTN